MGRRQGITHAGRMHPTLMSRGLMMALVLLVVSACSVDGPPTHFGDMLVFTTVAGDDPPPVVEVTRAAAAADLDGTTVSGTIRVEFASARRVISVDYYLDDPDLRGTPAFSTSTRPYVYLIDTTTMSDGEHLLTAVVLARRGNRTTSTIHEARFVVDNGGSPAPEPAPAPAPGSHAPSATFSVTPRTPVVGEMVTFDAGRTTCAAGPCSFAWTDTLWRDNPLGTGQVMTRSFVEPGTIGVRLTVTDALGRSATHDVTVTVAASDVAPPPAAPPTGGPTASDILWHADHETGSISQWSAGGCGGAFNNGGATATASTRFARTGAYSTALTIGNVSGDQGARLFRWCESRTHEELYYSTWMYFPERYVPSGGWWNVLQFKSNTGSVNDPFFILNVTNDTSGAMLFYLYDWQERRSYNQSIATIPVGRWFHVEVRYQASGSTNGRVTVWQDGVQVFDVSGVRTRYADGDAQWSVNNYASGIRPDPATIYVDDATISRTRVGPQTDVAGLIRSRTATAAVGD